MQTILFADRSLHALSALFTGTAAALLPLAGKAVIEYSLEELADAGIKEVIVVIGPQASELRALLGSGERWGLSLRIALSRGNELPSQLVTRFARQLRTEFTAMRGDCLRSRAVRSFLASAASAPGKLVFGEDSNGAVGMIRVPDVATGINALNQLGGKTNTILTAASVSLPDLVLFPLDTCAGILEANFALMSNGLPGVLRAGVEMHGNVRRGRLCKIGTQQVDSAAVYIGDHVQTHASVLFRGNVIVGADSFIDKNTTLENCVILPGTYVGAGLDLRDCIVSNKGIQKADSATPLLIQDPVWLATSHSQPKRGVSCFERCVAIWLLFLWVVMWPLVCARALMSREKPEYKARSRVMSAQPTMTELLPGLLAVARGKLHLIGPQVSDAATNTLRIAQGSNTRQLSPGLLSPARIHLSCDAPEEEIWMTELLYALSPAFQKTRFLISGKWIAEGSTTPIHKHRGD